METREYFEKVMQDYNQNRKGRSLRKYCKDEAVDYDWLIEFKKSYRSNKLQPDENKKLGAGERSSRLAFLHVPCDDDLLVNMPGGLSTDFRT